jgi:hypothetical protein
MLNATEITAVLEKIAAEHLDLDTIQTRSSDELDFSDQAVWNLNAALAAAFAAGEANAPANAKERAQARYDRAQARPAHAFDARCPCNRCAGE